MQKVRNPAIRKLLENDENLSEDRIEFVVRQFLGDVKNGVWDKNGWPEVWTDYAVSKLALNAYSRLLARRYNGNGLSVNCYCPGFTQTSMTDGQGKYTPDHAAETGAKFALLPPYELPTGRFYISSDPVQFSKL